MRILLTIVLLSSGLMAFILQFMVRSKINDKMKTISYLKRDFTNFDAIKALFVNEFLDDKSYTRLVFWFRLCFFLFVAALILANSFFSYL